MDEMGDGGSGAMDENDYVPLGLLQLSLALGGGGGGGHGSGPISLSMWIFPLKGIKPGALICHRSENLPFLSLDPDSRLIINPLGSGKQSCASIVRINLQKWTHIGCEIGERSLRLLVNGCNVAECEVGLLQGGRGLEFRGAVGVNSSMLYVYRPKMQRRTMYREEHLCNLPMELTLVSSNLSSGGKEDDGEERPHGDEVFAVVGGKASCRRKFALDVQLVDALGRPMERDLEVVASLVYADTETPLRKTHEDAEAPLLTTFDGVEYPSAEKPTKLVGGRASFKLTISQLSSKCDNRLFRVCFQPYSNSLPHPFLRCLSMPIQSVSRKRPHGAKRGRQPSADRGDAVLDVGQESKRLALDDDTGDRPTPPLQLPRSLPRSNSRSNGGGASAASEPPQILNCPTRTSSPKIPEEELYANGGANEDASVSVSGKEAAEKALGAVRRRGPSTAEGIQQRMMPPLVSADPLDQSAYSTARENSFTRLLMSADCLQEGKANNGNGTGGHSGGGPFAVGVEKKGEGSQARGSSKKGGTESHAQVNTPGTQIGSRSEIFRQRGPDIVEGESPDSLFPDTFATEFSLAEVANHIAALQSRMSSMPVDEMGSMSPNSFGAALANRTKQVDEYSHLQQMLGDRRTEMKRSVEDEELRIAHLDSLAEEINKELVRRRENLKLKKQHFVTEELKVHRILVSGNQSTSDVGNAGQVYSSREQSPTTMYSQQHYHPMYPSHPTLAKSPLGSSMATTSDACATHISRGIATEQHQQQHSGHEVGLGMSRFRPNIQLDCRFGPATSASASRMQIPSALSMLAPHLGISQSGYQNSIFVTENLLTHTQPPPQRPTDPTLLNFHAAQSMGGAFQPYSSPFTPHILSPFSPSPPPRAFHSAGAVANYQQTSPQYTSSPSSNTTNTAPLSQGRPSRMCPTQGSPEVSHAASTSPTSECDAEIGGGVTPASNNKENNNKSNKENNNEESNKEKKENNEESMKGSEGAERDRGDTSPLRLSPPPCQLDQGTAQVGAIAVANQSAPPGGPTTGDSERPVVAAGGVRGGSQSLLYLQPPLQRTWRLDPTSDPPRSNDP